MSKKINLLKRIVKELSPDKVDFSAVDLEIDKIKKQLEETVNIKTIDDVDKQLKSFQKRLDFSGVLKEVNSIGETFTNKIKELQELIDAKSEELKNAEENFNLAEGNRIEGLDILKGELDGLVKELSKRESSHKKVIEGLTEEINSLREIETRANKSIELMAKEFSVRLDSRVTKKESEESVKLLNEAIDQLRADILTRLSHRSGGNINRQILINSNDPLTKYTDINLKPGNNVTITYANNETTKKVDVTITASGTGGGITRSINSISASTSAGDTADTDYVYVCTDTLTLTLPTAVGNENLYTVKNTGSGIVTIDTTGGQTIDGDATIVMPVQYTSVDLISDSLNWNVT